ncbi:hypothetical protein TNIN_364301 [Trichonephila inaurata madagascariensis]|uniref:Uncharacterized protein n=1 Tax=Trichonephila inaurata madagascariensis TaxID=2747483 RepID=A0A8X7CJQ9_9ARAC|nr:hypothetical protein TNIN_364301 [Trichonephila inaurata madagascariensis]
MPAAVERKRNEPFDLERLTNHHEKKNRGKKRTGYGLSKKEITRTIIYFHTLRRKSAKTFLRVNLAQIRTHLSGAWALVHHTHNTRFNTCSLIPSLYRFKVTGNPRKRTPDGRKDVKRVPVAPEWTVGTSKGVKRVWYAGLKGTGCPEVNGSGCFGCLPGIFKTETAA